MPVSYTKRVGQVGTLFSSLFHLKLPKAVLGKQYEGHCLSSQKNASTPSECSQLFPPHPRPRHFNQNNRKFSGRLHNFYTSDGCSLANWLPHFYNPLGFLPSLAHSYICQHEFKSISVYFIHDLLYSLVNSCILSPRTLGTG